MKHDDTNSKPTILVVDDAPESLAMIREQLKDVYKVKAAPKPCASRRSPRFPISSCSTS